MRGPRGLGVLEVCPAGGAGGLGVNTRGRWETASSGPQAAAWGEAWLSPPQQVRGCLSRGTSPQVPVELGPAGQRRFIDLAVAISLIYESFRCCLGMLVSNAGTRFQTI